MYCNRYFDFLVWMFPSPVWRTLQTFLSHLRFFNSITGSAVCAFYMDDIEKAFNGKFKEQRNSESAWTPVPEEQVPKPRWDCHLHHFPRFLWLCHCMCCCYSAYQHNTNIKKSISKRHLLIHLLTFEHTQLSFFSCLPAWCFSCLYRFGSGPAAVRAKAPPPPTRRPPLFPTRLWLLSSHILWWTSPYHPSTTNPSSPALPAGTQRCSCVWNSCKGSGERSVSKKTSCQVNVQLWIWTAAS